MDADWITSPTARRVIAHWADARPTWLWSQDGSRLLWRNDAARFFRGKIKKQILKLAPEAVPIRGQVARLVRLGTPGRSSLSRIQFLSGDKPISTTCACTPLQLPGELALLIVAVDPIETELLEAEPHRSPDNITRKLLPTGSEFLLIDDDSQIAGGSAHALANYAEFIESEGMPELPDGESGDVIVGSETVHLSRYRASPHEAMLLVFQPAAETAQHPPVTFAAPDPRPSPEPLLPLGIPEEPLEPAQDVDDTDEWVEPIPEPEDYSLSSLFDRLAGDEGLYSPLTSADETFSGPAAVPPAEILRPKDEDPEDIEAIRNREGIDPGLPVRSDEDARQDGPPYAEINETAEPQEARSRFGSIAEILAEEGIDPAPHLTDSVAISDEDQPAGEAQAVEASEVQPATLWRLIGRGFTPVEHYEPPPAEIADAANADTEAMEPPVEEPARTEVDPDTIETVSRYNFGELGRILSDRIARASAEPPAGNVPAGNDSSLVNLAGETFILNRLPIGILVFRDQQVLFANRALTELTGHDNIESVRSGGLSAVFPAEDAIVGPVTQLVRKDGSLVAVNARLQSIAWHGRPALMLSASRADAIVGHEAAVRTFAELAAETSEDGFLRFDRSGVITEASMQTRVLLGLSEEELVGRPIAALIEPAMLGELKAFLERPARFAETTRPALQTGLTISGASLAMFAEGQAGIIAGYFGFVRRRIPAAPAAAPLSQQTADDLDSTILARMSRGLRQPLNSIIGFADMLGGANGAALTDERRAEYARDIRSAGREIADLVAELDDYARLKEGQYPAQADDIELAALLETCLLRVKGQAAEARVLVRNAVSERLPAIVADRASLTQAILNLLASAIGQTPQGGSVILSAQREDDGSISINLRDGGNTRRDFGERFMVFRDGTGTDGSTRTPVRSSVGLALTRSLLAVNALSLSVDPNSGPGTLFSLTIPADKVTARG